MVCPEEAGLGAVPLQRANAWKSLGASSSGVLRSSVSSRSYSPEIFAPTRRFGVHRSTYYHWKRQVDRHGLEMLRPRERPRDRSRPGLAGRRGPGSRGPGFRCDPDQHSLREGAGGRALQRAGSPSTRYSRPVYGSCWPVFCAPGMRAPTTLMITFGCWSSRWSSSRRVPWTGTSSPAQIPRGRAMISRTSCLTRAYQLGTLRVSPRPHPADRLRPARDVELGVDVLEVLLHSSPADAKAHPHVRV